MNKLTQYLVDSILNEGEEEIIALYGGGFKPPTKGHFEVVKTALQQNPEITNLRILVGSKERDGVDQAEAVLVWEIYTKYLPMKVDIIPSKKPPIGEIYSYSKKNPSKSIYWVIGAREDNEDDFKDIEGRSKGMEKYPNITLKPVVTSDKGMSGTNARLALKTRNVKEFEKYLPTELSKEDIEEVFQILSPSVEENKTLNESLNLKDRIDYYLNYFINISPSNFDLSIENNNILIGGFNKPYPPNFNDTKDIKQVPVGDEIQPLNEGILDKTSLVLPRGKKIYLQAESEEYDRGLIVELTEEGGYKINYWYGEDAKIYPVEVVVDSESVKPDAKEVWMKFHPELKKETLDEGRYDTISNQISGDIFNHWKSNMSEGSIFYKNTYIFEDDEIEVEATLDLLPNSNNYKVDGGAYSEEDLISVEFKIDPEFLPDSWSEISMDLKDVVRHEIEHLTHGEGFQEKPGKYMDSDSTLRTMIDSELLPKSDYFKLEKEIDANLQGMYFKAKKENKPFRDVIDIYLKKLNLTPQEQEGIVDIWSKRTKALSLPSINENYQFKNTSTDFDEIDNSLLTVEYKFNTPNNSYRVEFYSGEYNPKDMTFDLSFGVNKGEFNKLDTFQNTGEGNIREIIKTLSDIIEDFLNKYPDVKNVVISGTDDKRKRIYKNLFPKHLSSNILNKVTINENATYSKHIDYKQQIKDLTKYMLNQKMNIIPLPKVIFKHGNQDNAENFFGKTAYYDPNSKTIVLFTEGRHPKDIVRSFAHEMIHHIQNLEGRLEGITTTNTQEDDHLTSIEAEAYQDGNLAFRGYTDTILNENIFKKSLDQTEKEALEIVDKNWDKFGGKECNKGFCDIFAKNLSKHLPGSKIMSTEDPRNETLGHVWVEYKGKYFDAETPNGVPSWEELPWMEEFHSKVGNYPSDIERLNEAKQVGLLYHVTSPQQLEKILNSNTLRGSYISWDGGETDFLGISTTRNKNFLYDNNKIQIVLDGDKISNNYKVMPYDYWMRNYNIPGEPQTQDEDEEIIKVGEGGLKSVKDYIIKINDFTESINEEVLPQEKFAQETGKDWAKESLRIVDLKNYDLENYTIKILPLESVKPTQFGEDYINASSEYEAEVYDEYLKGEIEARDVRKEDFYPIIVDKDTMEILDGNHRHAVHTMLNLPKIKAILISKKLNKNINEAKQVGDLYHFTLSSTLKDILNSEYIKGSSNGISSTRDKNLDVVSKFYNFKLAGGDSQWGGLNVRITLDGDKISNNIKVTPIKDISFAKTKKKKYRKKGDKWFSMDEREELIKTSKLPLTPYVKEILIDGGKGLGVFNKLKEISNIDKFKHLIRFNYQPVNSSKKSSNINISYKEVEDEIDEDNKKIPQIVDTIVTPEYIENYKTMLNNDNTLSTSNYSYFYPKDGKRISKITSQITHPYLIDLDSPTQNKVDSILKLNEIKKSKDPFGLNQYARELAQGLEEELEKTRIPEEEVVSSPKDKSMDYIIYSDMDGVITDFEGRFKNYSNGISPSEYQSKNGVEKFWDLIDVQTGVKFWVGMPWMEDGKQYWDYISKYKPILLSSPSIRNESRLGKRLWVKNNIPGTPLKLAYSKNKKNYAQENAILIDDRENNINQWIASGGIGILHTSASDTIRQLKELGL
mgnify:CR=1 FL=1